MDIIDEMSMDEKEWELYMSRHRAILDYNTGMREAREEGAKIEKLEIVKNMIKKGIDVNTIEEITGLTKEEIEKMNKSK